MHTLFSFTFLHVLISGFINGVQYVNTNKGVAFLMIFIGVMFAIEALTSAYLLFKVGSFSNLHFSFACHFN